jgi:hypothetical protein
MATTFQVNQFTRVHDDSCGVDAFYRQSVGPGFYRTMNLVPQANDVVPKALDNPTIIAKEGYGLTPASIDKDSILRNHMIQTSGQKCPINLQSRPFLTVPFMGRGRGEAELEAKLQQSEYVRTGKDCGTVTDKPFAGQFTPLLPHVERNIQNPVHIVPEVAASGWIRGGIPSRQYVRDLNA